MSYARHYLDEVARIAALLDVDALERLVSLLVTLRTQRGRLFLIGVGGSAANCSHAACDFRKLAGIEAYAAADNVAELTARTNDDGWAQVFAGWLEVSRLSANDIVLVMSVGGGSVEPPISANLVQAIDYAHRCGASVAGIVGRDGGYTATAGDICIVVPTVEPGRVTPHTEAFQAVIWHLLVSHPALQRRPTTWESVQPCG